MASSVIREKAEEIRGRGSLEKEVEIGGGVRGSVGSSGGRGGEHVGRKAEEPIPGVGSWVIQRRDLSGTLKSSGNWSSLGRTKSESWGR